MQRFMFALFVLILVVLNVLGTYNGLTSRSPGMNDFMSRWEGARSFWVDGISPYSSEATLNIQNEIYGRAAVDGEDLGLFAYPMYTVFFLLPLVYLPYAWASAVWMVLLEVCLVVALILLLKFLRWRPSLLMQVMLFIFTLVNYYAFRGLILGQMSHIVYLMMIVALWNLSKGYDSAAGIVLALSTIKPQMGFLLVPLLLLWGMREGRWYFVGGFAGLFSVLMGASFVLEPTWFVDWVEQVRLYPTYTRDGSPVWILFEQILGLSPIVGYVARGVLVGWMFWAWWGVLVERRQERLLWTIAVTLLVTHTAGPRTATPHFMVFMLVLLIVMQMFAKRGRSFWNWLIMLFLLIVPWLHFITTIIDSNLENLAVFLPPVILVLISLLLTRRYWWESLPLLLSQETS